MPSVTKAKANTSSVPTRKSNRQHNVSPQEELDDRAEAREEKEIPKKIEEEDVTIIPKKRGRGKQTQTQAKKVAKVPTKEINTNLPRDALKEREQETRPTAKGTKTRQIRDKEKESPEPEVAGAEVDQNGGSEIEYVLANVDISFDEPEILPKKKNLKKGRSQAPPTRETRRQPARGRGKEKNNNTEMEDKLEKSDGENVVPLENQQDPVKPLKSKSNERNMNASGKGKHPVVESSDTTEAVGDAKDNIEDATHASQSEDQTQTNRRRVTQNLKRKRQSILVTKKKATTKTFILGETEPTPSVCYRTSHS